MIYKHVLFYKNKFIICIFLRQNANEIYTELKVCPISYVTRQRSLSYLSSVGAKSADQVPWFYHPHCPLTRVNVIFLFFFFFLNPSMSRWIFGPTMQIYLGVPQGGAFWKSKGPSEAICLWLAALPKPNINGRKPK